jgi:hypothetical protein
MFHGFLFPAILPESQEIVLKEFLMRKILIPMATALMLAAASRPPDITFRVKMIDPGASETAAVVDVNKDGRLDIVSGDSWYEAPSWKKHPIREINFTSNYVDNFSDLVVDVDGDGYPDIVQFGYFSGNIVWMKNPGKTVATEKEWVKTEIDASGPTEFAFLVDLNNDGKALEILPEFDRANVPLAWFELKDHKWVKHVVSQQSYGHGIGAGDLNGDSRNDILTPKGWFEAPPDPASGQWTFHATDWETPPAPAGRAGAPAVAPPAPARTSFGFMYVLDINGDGRMDILTTAAHDYGIFWFEQMPAEPGKDPVWVRHTIDNSWSQAHASQLVDLNGDGQLDLVTGKRYMAHNGTDPGEKEPLGLYWYEYRKAPAGGRVAGANGGVEWIRHLIDYGGRMGAGMQTRVVDIDGDGDLDVVSGGKSGVFVAENMTKSPATSPLAVSKRTGAP